MPPPSGGGIFASGAVMLEWQPVGRGVDHLDGWYGNRYVARVVHYDRGWMGFVIHEHIDQIHYATAEEAIAAVEASPMLAVALTRQGSRTYGESP